MKNAEMIEKISALNVTNYGVYSENLSHLLRDLKDPKCVIMSLNNCDTDGVLLQLLKTHEKEIYEGLKVLADAIGAKKMILNLPVYAPNLDELKAQAHSHDVSVEVGIVDKRAHVDDLVIHIVTALEVYDALHGKLIEGVYVSINGGPIKKLPKTTTIKELVGDVRGVRTAYIIRNAHDLKLTIGDVRLANAVLNPITDKDCVVSICAEKLLADRVGSCGKCVFCREGLLQLEQMVKDMTIGKGKSEYLDLCVEIGSAMGYSSACSMGQTSANLLLTALKAFPDEFKTHIKKKKCPADACLAFRKVYIDPHVCNGCTKCMKACPENTIDGAQGYIHIVFENNCTKCEKCVPVCPVNAIHVTTDTVPSLPPKMLRTGKFRNL